MIINNKTTFNIQTSIVNLLDIKKILDLLNIEFYPAFGTFLGMYRQGNLIEWDSDTDIIVINGAYDKIKQNITIFQKNGFDVMRCNTTIMSLIRNENYTDIYPFYFNKSENRYKNNNGVYYIDPENFSEKKYMECFGVNWLIFNNPEKYLKDRYGEDWYIPKNCGSANN